MPNVRAFSRTMARSSGRSLSDTGAPRCRRSLPLRPVTGSELSLAVTGAPPEARNRRRVPHAASRRHRGRMQRKGVSLPCQVESHSMHRRCIVNGGSRHFREQLAGRYRYANHPETESKTERSRNSFLCFVRCRIILHRNDMRNAERFAVRVSRKWGSRKKESREPDGVPCRIHASKGVI